MIDGVIDGSHVFIPDRLMVNTSTVKEKYTHRNLARPRCI